MFRRMPTLVFCFPHLIQIGAALLHQLRASADVWALFAFVRDLSTFFQLVQLLRELNFTLNRIPSKMKGAPSSSRTLHGQVFGIHERTVEFLTWHDPVS